jgi:hypothetical protein
MEHDITQWLISLYTPLEFTQIYGKSNIEYVCALSARYSLAVLPPHLVKPDAYSTLALWLSAVWAIDGLFDKLKTLVTINDVNMVKSIFEVPGLGPKPISSQVRIISSLMSALSTLYGIYKERMKQYMDNATNNGWSMLNYWTDRYLGTLVLDYEPKTEPNYQILRLDTGAMMCVVAQSIIFTNVTHNVGYYDDLMCDASIAVSYYNDLLSMMRDVAQGTPNLVGVIIKSSEEIDLWSAMERAVAHTNNFIAKVHNATNREPVLKDIATTITMGSIDWHKKEPRYKSGYNILKCFEQGDRAQFDDMTSQLELNTPGDPNALTK